MKIRVLYSDGEFRGGLYDTDYVSVSRNWRGRPHEHYTEYMVANCAMDEPCDDDSWLLVRMSRHPQITGSRACDDEFDHESYALRVTPMEVVRWFQEEGRDLPPELRSRADLLAPLSGNDGSAQDSEMPKLTPAQQQIWDLLENGAAHSKTLAMEVFRDPRKANTIRQRIVAIRRTGRAIEHDKERGYFRPDVFHAEPVLQASA